MCTCDEQRTKRELVYTDDDWSTAPRRKCRKPNRRLVGGTCVSHPFELPPAIAICRVVRFSALERINAVYGNGSNSPCPTKQPAMNTKDSSRWELREVQRLLWAVAVAATHSGSERSEHTRPAFSNDVQLQHIDVYV